MPPPTIQSSFSRQYRVLRKRHWSHWLCHLGPDPAPRRHLKQCALLWSDTRALLKTYDIIGVAGRRGCQCKAVEVYLKGALGKWSAEWCLSVEFSVPTWCGYGTPLGEGKVCGTTSPCPWMGATSPWKSQHLSTVGQACPPDVHVPLVGSSLRSLQFHGPDSPPTLDTKHLPAAVLESPCLPNTKAPSGYLIVFN